MKKNVTLYIVIMIIATVLAGCTTLKCSGCKSNNVKYKVTFDTTGSTEYLCENCYAKLAENPTYNVFWSVETI